MSRTASQALWSLALAVLLLVGCADAPPSTVEVPGISYIKEKRRTPADVARISEAFNADESHGNDVIFRTTEKERAGFYYNFRLDFTPPKDGRIILEVVRSETAPTERYDFALNFQPKGWLGEYIIGLTGPESGAANWRPIAWRLSIVDATGKVLASQHSFLWSKDKDPLPPAKL